MHVVQVAHAVHVVQVVHAVHVVQVAHAVHVVQVVHGVHVVQVVHAVHMSCIYSARLGCFFECMLQVDVVRWRKCRYFSPVPEDRKIARNLLMAIRSVATLLFMYCRYPYQLQGQHSILSAACTCMFYQKNRGQLH